MISSPFLVTLALGALSAGLALLMARWQLPVVADVLAIASALLGLTAFIAALVTTVRSARRVPSGPRR